MKRGSYLLIIFINLSYIQQLIRIYDFMEMPRLIEIFIYAEIVERFLQITAK